MEFLNLLQQAKKHVHGFIACLLLIVLLTNVLQGPLLLAAKHLEASFSQQGILIAGMDKNLYLTLSLLPFIGIWLALYLVTTKIHKTPFRNLISASKSIDKKRILFGFIVWIVFSACGVGLDYYFHGDQYQFQFNLLQFIPLILISLTLIPIQTSAEELLVRSYFMQMLGVSTNKRWIPILLTSTIFGLLHLANPEVHHFGLLTALPMYIGSGIIFAICTVMDDRLELALGMHAANNIFISIFITNENSTFQTYALFDAPMNDMVLNYTAWILGSAFFLFLAHKTFKWGSWKYLIQEKSDH